MPIYEFEGKCPSIDPSAWVAPSADVIGDVRIGPECYVGWQAVLRGDHGTIILEKGFINTEVSELRSKKFWAPNPVIIKAQKPKE